MKYFKQDCSVSYCSSGASAKSRTSRLEVKPLARRIKCVSSVKLTFIFLLALFLRVYRLGVNPPRGDFMERLPFALLGTGSVIFLYFLVKRVFKGDKLRESTALLAALFLAISPWHIQFSRLPLMVVAGLFLFVCGLLAVFSSNFFIRILGIFLLVLGLITSKNVLPESLVRNSYQFFYNFFSYLSFEFLFFKGTKDLIFGLQEIGESYFFTLPLFLVGFCQLFKKPKRDKVIVVICFFLGFLLGSFNKERYDARRAFLSVAPFQVIIAYGGACVLPFFRRNWQRSVVKLLALVVLILIFYEIIFYLHLYHVHYYKTLLNM